MIEKLCRSCFRSFPAYNTVTNICQVCAFNRYNKLRKPLSRVGKRSREYDVWRRTVAIPYLDKKGHRCAVCGSDSNLEIDHILTRGSRPDLKMELTNVRYLCTTCHKKRHE